MSLELAEWFEERSKSLGVSQSGVMVMALSEYVKQEKAMNMMGNFESIMQQLSDLKDNTPVE